MHQKHIAIFTIENDLHALAVKKAFEDYKDVICHIIEVDRICNSSGLSWSSTEPSVIPTRDGELLDVRNLHLIWWRRINYPQKVPASVIDPAQIDLINNDCRAAFFGLLFTKFSGQWINEPNATLVAENKLVQLHIAQHAGFRVPRTLVSQDPRRIREFYTMLGGSVIVKPVRGTHQFHLLTKMLTEEHITSEDSLRLCPAIYQEYIPGCLHLRVHCFGHAFYTVLIESRELDWRINLDVPFRPFDLPEDTKMRIHRILTALGIKMGIIDLKLAQNTTPVWLEVNPQGQFLFVEGTSGLGLTSAFVEFLYQEVNQIAL